MIVTRGYGSGAIVTRGYSATSSDYEFIQEFFKHIWPAKSDPLSISAIGTTFYLRGVAFERSIYSKSTVFWTNSISRVMFVKSNKDQ